MSARAQWAASALIIVVILIACPIARADTMSDSLLPSAAATLDHGANSAAAAPAQPAAPTQAAQPAVTAPAQTAYSAAALYNLANSYARAGKPALAVLNYERASLLAPHDPDIDANLRYVREASHLPPESATRFARAATVAGPTALSWMGVIGILLIGASALAGQASFPYRWPHRAAVGLGIALVGLAVGNAVVMWPKLHEAVIVTAAAPVRVSPVPMGDPLFVLPEAETVRMMAQHEDFVLVRASAGRTGWVSRADLVPVVPAQDASF